jgi:hypothetical protein
MLIVLKNYKKILAVNSVLRAVLSSLRDVKQTADFFAKSCPNTGYMRKSKSLSPPEVADNEQDKVSVKRGFSIRVYKVTEQS